MSQGRLAVLERDVAKIQGSGGQVANLSKAAIYKDLRQSAAMAAGLESIATRAIEGGEATEETLEYIATLAARLRQDVSKAALAIAELSDQH